MPEEGSRKHATIQSQVKTEVRITVGNQGPCLAKLVESEKRDCVLTGLVMVASLANHHPDCLKSYIWGLTCVLRILWLMLRCGEWIRGFDEKGVNILFLTVSRLY